MPEKILIVDDDLETLRLVGLMLQRQGFKIVAANNGTQALAMAKSEVPDLIVLDVMMPDLDGYQVTRMLRQENETAHTPIILFTAKSQVEDKVQGYEVGADDYLTKPIHPAELVAHIKALLSRGRKIAAAAAAVPVAPPPPEKRGYVIGVVAPKGGVGCSSIVLNLALTLQQKTREEIIAMETRPGQGTWAMEMNFNGQEGLSNLLRMKPEEITGAAIEKELFRTTYGLRLLLASNTIKDVDLISAGEQLEAVTNKIATLSTITLIDIGTCYLPNFKNVLMNCNEVILITEPQPHTIQRTRSMMDELNTLGFGKSRLLTVVLANRVRADVQYSITQVQEALSLPTIQMIPPAPEQAYQADLRNVPLIHVQPEGLVAQQFSRISEVILQHRTK